MVRWTAVVLASILASSTACAGSTADGEIAREMLRLAGSREASPPRDGSEQFVSDTVAAPLVPTLRAVNAAYGALGIPLTLFEPERAMVGGFVRELGELEGAQPSDWVDCGSGATAEFYADRYSVSAAIATRVVPVDSATSAVSTVIRVRARARDVTADYLRCTSLRTLELAIAARVSERVDRGPGLR